VKSPVNNSQTPYLQQLAPRFRLGPERTTTGGVINPELAGAQSHLRNA
jgi:hypothetical protein